MANGKRVAAVIAGAAGGSLLTAFLIKAEEARAAPAPEGIDPQVWDMLLTNIEAVTLQTANIEALIVTLGGVPATLVAADDPFENATRFVTGQVICTALNQGFQLPSFPIPKNKQLIVKAMPGNVGWIFVGSTQADSQNITISFMLVPNEGIGLFVKNSEVVWVMAPAPPIGALNDGVAFMVEQ